MKTLIKDGWLVDPSQNLFGVYDILIEEDKIVKIHENIVDEEATVIQASGLYICPGLVDMHVHLREPGYEYKETIESGALAAVAGGFTSIACMPNTNPVIDNKEVVEYVKNKGKNSKCNVYIMGSITKNLDGEEKSPYKELAKSGIVAITDDGKTVMNTRIMYEAMMDAKALGMPVSVHCEDAYLVYDRSINKGKVSEKLNLTGVPALAEEIIIWRDTVLADITECHVHIQHISTKKGLDLIRDAKKNGVMVSCEVTPHHITLTEEEVEKIGTNAKMSPPLRKKEDVEALIQGLFEGTIDVIATDHAPHSREEKDSDLTKAANGIVGLETSLGIALTELVHKRNMPLPMLIDKMSRKPSELLKIPGGTLKAGSFADIVIIDLEKEWTVDRDKFYSKSKNSPFQGRKLKGKAIATIVRGQIQYSEM
ncbi:dihydroorotase [Clostridium sp. MSJ-11]|uniref:Dihydroorotase n=1 Tax=Clostridium mobile TaxID=2841512 RepID=A0ABS6EGR5_9CLOT|nr:dihydroorotase [Clostridium mobile]MBU5483670.1 dihydroorotase [Clostridium mobile]